MLRGRRGSRLTACAVLLTMEFAVVLSQDAGSVPGDNTTTPTGTPTSTTQPPDPTTRTPTPTTRTPTPTTRTPTPTTDAPAPTTPSPTSRTPEPPVSTTQTPPIPTTETPSTDPSTTTPTAAPPVATTAAPVVKHYNSSTLPPGVSPSILNGTELDTVEVTETTDANGRTSYSYTIVTTNGSSATRTVYVPTATSGTGSSGSTLSDGSSSSSSESSGLGVGVIVGIIAGCLVLMIVLLVFFAARRRQAKHRQSDVASEDVLALPGVGKQVRLLQNGEMEYQDNTRTTANTRSSGDVSRRYHSSLWEDPVITAARIPIDRVEVGAIISRGGFGEVYRGRYRDQDVAIKTLLPEKRKDMQYIQAFLSEVRLMATMEHPNIVEFIGVAWESLSDLYCVTEFMAGGDLRTLLKDYLLTGVPQGMDASKMQIAYHVAHALTYLHSLQPVVLHRDLKSRNILLTTSLDAKLTDFGTSRIRSDSTMTAGVGSSLWMAPEVMMGKRYDEKADVFSLGVVMSELDTHELPYSHAKEPSDNSSGVRSLPDAAILQMVSTGKLRVRFSRFLHPDIVRFANTCVSMDPRDRPTAAEVLYFLQVAIRNQQY